MPLFPPHSASSFCIPPFGATTPGDAILHRTLKQTPRQRQVPSFAQLLPLERLDGPGKCKVTNSGCVSWFLSLLGCSSSQTEKKTNHPRSSKAHNLKMFLFLYIVKQLFSLQGNFFFEKKPLPTTNASSLRTFPWPPPP